MREIRDTYFKDFNDGVGYISGLPVPKGEDGICRGIRFIDCSFHAGMRSAGAVKFVDCEFINCERAPKLTTQAELDAEEIAKGIPTAAEVIADQERKQVW